MIERMFVLNGRISAALLAGGLVAHALHPGSAGVLWLLYAGLLLLILTPVTRVSVAAVRYFVTGDRGSAALAIAILAVIAISAWVGAT